MYDIDMKNTYTKCKPFNKVEPRHPLAEQLELPGAALMLYKLYTVPYTFNRDLEKGSSEQEGMIN